MTRSQKIKKKCLQYCSYTQKELSLCHIVDCPLWTNRFGYSMKDKRFWKRMETARKNYPKDFAELLELIPDYLKILPNTPETALICAFYSRACQPESLSLNQTASDHKRDYPVHNEPGM